MKINRIMIAAPKSGSGKTTITCALLEKMKESTSKVISFKCGPDYIDPMFHERVLGITSRNLDTFFTGEEATRALFQQNANGYDLAVMEGVMGLYDGLGGIRPEGSSYHLAQVTQTPILLVIDAKGMGRSAIALLKGFLDYDTNHLIRGVLFNRMSKGYYDIIKPLVETELSIAVVGYLPENPLCHVPSRHLGLVMPQEVSDWKEDMRQIAEALCETVSMERILAIAGQAEELPQIASTCPGSACSSPAEADAPVIGVARDEAFCFYYADNIRMLEEAGAKVRYLCSNLCKKCESSGRKEVRIWRILIVFLKIVHVNIFRVIRDLRILIVCFATVRCITGNIAQGTAIILKKMGNRLRSARIVPFRISRRIMILSSSC